MACCVPRRACGGAATGGKRKGIKETAKEKCKASTNSVGLPGNRGSRVGSLFTLRVDLRNADFTYPSTVCAGIRAVFP